MFPQETHVKILKEIDIIEAELFGLYRKLARLRLGLQEQWQVKPDGKRWSREAQMIDEQAVR